MLEFWISKHWFPQKFYNSLKLNAMILALSHQYHFKHRCYISQAQDASHTHVFLALNRYITIILKPANHQRRQFKIDFLCSIRT